MRPIRSYDLIIIMITIIIVIISSSLNQAINNSALLIIACNNFVNSSCLIQLNKSIHFITTSGQTILKKKLKNVLTSLL